MKLGLDTYADLDSVIHRWEQRSKLVAMIALMFAFAFVDTLILLPAMILVTAILYKLSGLPLSFLRQRLRYPGLFILIVVILIPFVTQGTVLLDLGFVSITVEGMRTVLLVATRFLCILTVGLVLFGTAPFLTSVQAMRSLRLPAIMVDMTLLAYRYLEELGETLTTMRRASKLRGFQSNRFNLRVLRTWSGLAGSLLIRSYDRSERIYQAMRLRGYGHGKLHTDGTEGFVGDIFQANRNSQIAFWLTLLTATAFVAGIFFL
jgi:cobalt/nickel transport system permease protein